ncbi:hypothetical protein CJF30_00010824 [Rutstroemia sp. NJR-2017a BBW]|nr:hypothetical protein CJF30_00010824 [Rutstroemia sp. NJR-2017a BBW]
MFAKAARVISKVPVTFIISYSFHQPCPSLCLDDSEDSITDPDVADNRQSTEFVIALIFASNVPTVGGHSSESSCLRNCEAQPLRKEWQTQHCDKYLGIER